VAVLAWHKLTRLLLVAAQAVAEHEAAAERLVAKWREEGAALRSKHSECSRQLGELRRLATVAKAAAQRGTRRQFEAIDGQVGFNPLVARRE